MKPFMKPFTREAFTSNQRVVTARRLIVALGVVCAAFFAFGPQATPVAASSGGDLQCWRWIWEPADSCNFCLFKCKEGTLCCGPDL